MINISDNKIKMNNITLYSSKAFISESQDNPDVYICKFILCDFSINGNGVGLNRDTITEWMSTIKNKPVVGKIVVRCDNGEEDFSDHAVKLVQKVDSDGTTYTDMIFCSEAFGTFTDVSVENIDGVDYLVATAEIWKRFEKACTIILNRIQSGELNTSWEISVTDAVQKFVGGTIAKIINYGRFLGHALLGNGVAPAYPSSKLLNIAQEDNQDVEFTNALVEDILYSNIIIKEQEENNNLNKNTKIPEVEAKPIDPVIESSETTVSTETNTSESTTVETPVVDEVEVPEATAEAEIKTTTEEIQSTETSALTEWDLRSTVTKLNSDLSVRDKTIITLNSKIQDLTSEVTSLIPFKEEFEQAEQKRIEQELSTKKENLKANLIKAAKLTEKEFEASSELKGLVDTMDEVKINAFIVNKIISTTEEIALESEPTVEISTKKEASVKRESLETDAPIDYKAVMKNFLARN